MTPLAVLVPVKSSETKSRLAAVLSRKERREFTVLALSGVLGCIKDAGLIHSCHVISSDERFLGLAAQMGAGSIAEPRDEGVNAAVRRAVRELKGPETVLVLPSDLPLLKTSEIEHILSLKGGGLDVVVVPSRSFDGTNALVFSPRSGLPLRYDNNSFWNHLAGGARIGLSMGVSSETGLMFDVDSSGDLEVLARSRAGGAPVEFARRVRR